MQLQPGENLQAVNELLARSRVETDNLKERDLLCPICGFRIQTLYSDAAGHLRVKCPKCKSIHVLNLAYFRNARSNKKRHPRVFNQYYK